jgi:magnesium-transporting ATPase (P-type)
MSSSFSLRASHKFLAYYVQIDTKSSFLWGWFCSSRRLRKHRRTSNCITLTRSLIHGMQRWRQCMASSCKMLSSFSRLSRSDANTFDITWREIRIGDIMWIESDGFIPANAVVLSNSEPEGLWCMKTCHVDGYAYMKAPYLTIFSNMPFYAFYSNTNLKI